MSEKKATGPSGSGTSTLYFVEARITSTAQPFYREVNGIVLTRDWQRIQTRRCPDGAMFGQHQIVVPVEKEYMAPLAAVEGLLPCESAHALAVRFQVSSRGSAVFCMQTRLVGVRVSYSYETEEIGVGEPLSLGEKTSYFHNTLKAREQ